MLKGPKIQLLQKVSKVSHDLLMVKITNRMILGGAIFVLLEKVLTQSKNAKKKIVVQHKDTCLQNAPHEMSDFFWRHMAILAFFRANLWLDNMCWRRHPMFFLSLGRMLFKKKTDRFC